MGKQGRPPGSKDSRQCHWSKKTIAPKIQFRTNVQSVSALASEIASTSAFIASIHATGSSASVAADPSQDNNCRLRNNELEDEVSRINQQEFLSKNIDAELDDDNDVHIIDRTNGIMAIFVKVVHHELREEVCGRTAKER